MSICGHEEFKNTKLCPRCYPKVNVYDGSVKVSVSPNNKGVVKSKKSRRKSSYCFTKDCLHNKGDACMYGRVFVSNCPIWKGVR